MAFTIHANWVQKGGCAEAEYEDAFATRSASPSPENLGHPQCRVAIADGATDSWCSGLWARMLVDAATRGGSLDQLIEQFDQLRQKWRRKATPDDLDWVREEKARGGAHAAFLCASVRPPTAEGEEGHWSAWAIGDCCLFHLRAGALLASFPYTTPEQFSASPLLFETATTIEEIQSRVTRMEGVWQPGDVFLLATDAAALWFLRCADDTRRYGPDVLAKATYPQTRDQFGSWVAEARRSEQLGNDDTTFVCLRTG